MRILLGCALRCAASMWRGGALAIVFFVALPLSAVRAQSDLVRTQDISLQAGWNAVYLEIDPETNSPAALFAGIPVDVVAAYAAPRRGAQFVKNPTAGMLASYGWAVWYAPGRGDHFLSTLYAIYGAKPYLIHAVSNTSLTVRGTAAPDRTTWMPNAYNFVGFNVVTPGGPTFREFFRGSDAHLHNNLYRMTNGIWRQVLNPDSVAMRAGEAFWIYCSGPSDFAGPLQVKTPTRLGVVVSSRTGSEVIFRNRSTHPVSFYVEHLTDPAAPVPLSVPILATDESAGGGLRTVNVHLESGAWRQDFPALEAGASIRLPLELRVQDMAVGTRSSALKVVSDVGTVIYVPVTATREEQF